MLVLLSKVSQIAGGEELSDEIDALAPSVVPGAVAFDDVGVVQINSFLKLPNNGCHLFICQAVGILQDPAPSNVNALLEIKALVDMLESPGAHLLSISARAGKQLGEGVESAFQPTYIGIANLHTQIHFEKSR